MKFFVTCGSGLSPFFKQEVYEKFGVKVNEIEQVFEDGKVFFEVNNCPQNSTDKSAKIVENLVTNLKTVERLFGFVLHAKIDPKLNLKTRRSLLSHYYTIASNSEVLTGLQFWAGIKLQIQPEADEFTSNLPKRRKLEDSDTDLASIGFRINTRLQQLPHYLTNGQEVSKTFGSAIVKALFSKGWKIKLRNADLEVMVNINSTDILIGIPLTNKPISERSYLAHIPLRSTICYAMSSLLFKDNPADLKYLMVLDPMCGAGTILIELAKCFPTKIGMLYGVDRDQNQIIRAKENVKTAKVKSIVCLMQADCRTRFSVKFDAIICDLPFGNKHGTVKEIEDSLHDYLTSFNCNLAVGGKVVLLISDELSNFLERITNDADLNWSFIEKYKIREGVLNSVIFLFKKVN